MNEAFYNLPEEFQHELCHETRVSGNLWPNLATALAVAHMTAEPFRWQAWLKAANECESLHHNDRFKTATARLSDLIDAYFLFTSGRESGSKQSLESDDGLNLFWEYLETDQIAEWLITHPARNA